MPVPHEHRGNDKPREKRRRILEPHLSAVSFPDPRSARGHKISVIAFSSAGEQEEPWDTLCGARFLSSFYDLGPGGLQLEAPSKRGEKKEFGNAEAAFQALKFWPMAREFAELSGEAIQARLEKHAGMEDLTYSGYMTNWKAMWAVLNAKFHQGSPCAAALVKTEDAFLLEHRSSEGDKIWSDDCKGDGANWRGLQLMLIRDRLAGRNGWTRFIGNLFDTRTGDPLSPDAANRWQDTVRQATIAIVDQVDRRRPGTLASSSGARAGFNTVEGSQQHGTVDARDVHAALLDGVTRTPLELAALAKLRVWETSNDEYSVEELMGLARWLEQKLVEPEKPDHLKLWRRVVWEPLITRKWTASCGLCMVVVCMLVLVAAFTGLAVELSKVASVRPSGIMNAFAQDGDVIAGAGAAVQFHGLLDYQSLPISELRRVQDIAFSHQGAFSFYRLSAITKIPSGLRMTAEDGTIIWIEEDRVGLSQPFQPRTVLLLNETGHSEASWTASGLSRKVTLQSL